MDHEGEIYIVESKSIAAYLRQLQALGERVEDYSSLWDYTEGRTESRFALLNIRNRELKSRGISRIWKLIRDPGVPVSFE